MVCVMSIDELDRLMRKDLTLWGKERRRVLDVEAQVKGEVEHRWLMGDLLKELPRYIHCPLRSVIVHHSLYFRLVRRPDGKPITWPCVCCGGSHTFKGVFDQRLDKHGNVMMVMPAAWIHTPLAPKTKCAEKPKKWQKRSARDTFVFVLLRQKIKKGVLHFEFQFCMHDAFDNALGPFFLARKIVDSHTLKTQTVPH